MPVQEIGDRYKCSVCGNEVVIENVGGGTLFCCGLEMAPLDED